MTEFSYSRLVQTCLHHITRLLRLSHSLRLGLCTLLNSRPNCSINSPQSEAIVKISVNAVVRRVDLVICGEQWATSRVADHTYSDYSHIKLHSGQLITHGLIGVARPFNCRHHTPVAAEGIRFRFSTERRIFLYNAHFIVINFQRQLV